MQQGGSRREAGDTATAFAAEARWKGATRTAAKEYRLRGWLSVAATIVLMGFHSAAAAQPSGSTPRITHRLQVSRVRSIQLAERQVDEILVEMGNVLQVQDGSDDVACDVEFTRDGSVGTFDTTWGDGMIASYEELREIAGLPGDVKVVDLIAWCSSNDGQTINFTMAGCEFRGTFVVVVDLELALAGVVWTHEFGHVRGLPHRSDDPEVPKMIMNEGVGEENRQADGPECSRYRRTRAVREAS